MLQKKIEQVSTLRENALL